jgi:glycosyltransferase involved in cell wall biosynthesis
MNQLRFTRSPRSRLSRRRLLTEAALCPIRCSMRIVYPLLWSRPGRQACREQTMNTAAALARRGHDVTLLMPQERKDPTLTAGELKSYYAVEGDLRLIQRPSRWAGEKLERTLMWLRQVFRDPELSRADLLYSRIPAMLGMGQRSPLPFATDHYRPWPDDLPLIRPLVRRTARHRRCLGLVIHSHYAAEAYRRAGVAEERILVAHNGAAAEATGPRLTKEQARRLLDLPLDRPTAVYAGRINQQKGLDQILALADLRPEVLFLLVGSEGDGRVEREAAGRANVRVLPWAQPADLPRWLDAADVLLIPPSRAPLEQFRHCVLPMKLFAYLAAGRPILAPAAPDTAELLLDGKTASLVQPDLPEAAAAALHRLLADSQLGKKLGVNARQLSHGLTWDSRAAKISDFLEGRLAAQRSVYSSTVTPLSRTIPGAAHAPTAGGK